MGGSIGVTIRETDGTEHRMCRWTNSLPRFIHNIKFINKDIPYLKEYLKIWDDMEKDWMENKDNKDLRFKSEHVEIGKLYVRGGKPQKFRHNMTEIYAPYPFLAPISYGLVVIDMQKSVILSCQGYCGIGKFITSRASYNKEEVEAIDELNKAGRIISATDLDNKKVNNLKLDPNENYFYDIKVDLSPFVVKMFPESKYGINKMKKEVLKLGFKLSEEEEEMWKQYAKEYDE